MSKLVKRRFFFYVVSCVGYMPFPEDVNHHPWASKMISFVLKT